MHINPANYVPFAPNGFTGIHQGAAIVFFAYIGFDAISTAAEETRNPQRNLPIGILGGLAICTLIYVVVGAVITGMVPYTELGVADPLSRALEIAGLQAAWAGSWRSAPPSRCPRCCWCSSTGSPASSSRWRATACSPSGPRSIDPKTRTPAHHDAVHRHHRGRGVARRRRGRDLRPDQHRDALRLRAGLRRRPGAPRDGARAPAAVQGAVRVGRLRRWACAACLFIMVGLPRQAWERFGLWLVIGSAIYAFYGFRHSQLTRS